MPYPHSNSYKIELEDTSSPLKKESRKISFSKINSIEENLKVMKALTVTELTSAIKSLLEPQFRALSVQGEISNFKMQASGHN
jgi:hypothetical protein